MSIAGDTQCALAGDKKLGELRMALMKLDVVQRDLFENSDRLFFAAVFLLETNEKLDIPRFGNQAAFPSRIDEVFKLFRFFVFFLTDLYYMLR
jgi:hypothetical protein